MTVPTTDLCDLMVTLATVDIALGEDERVLGFPMYLIDRSMALVKAEGLRQAAAVLGQHDDASGYDPATCPLCATSLFLEIRADHLEESAVLALAGSSDAT